MHKKTAYQLLMAVDDKLQLVERDLQSLISRLEDFITDNKHREEGFDNWLSEIRYAIGEIRDILSWLR